MLNKIYLILLAVFFLGMCVLTYMAYDWLGSLTAPIDVKNNFEYFMNIGRKFLWISTLILLVAANVILWKTRTAWAFWTTFVYFAFFILLQTFWLDRAFMDFQEAKGLSDTSLSISPFIGVLLFIAAGAFIYFNQFLLTRMHDRMFSSTPIQELPDADVKENAADESE